MTCRSFPFSQLVTFPRDPNLIPDSRGHRFVGIPPEGSFPCRQVSCRCSESFLAPVSLFARSQDSCQHCCSSPRTLNAPTPALRARHVHSSFFRSLSPFSSDLALSFPFIFLTRLWPRVSPRNFPATLFSPPQWPLPLSKGGPAEYFLSYFKSPILFCQFLSDEYSFLL